MRNSWIRMLVAHSECAGEPLAFSLPNHFGNVPSRPQVKGISAHNRVQDRNAPPTEIIRPRLIRAAPHGPTSDSNTPAIDGTLRAPSSGWLRMPVASIETR